MNHCWGCQQRTDDGIIRCEECTNVSLAAPGLGDGAHDTRRDNRPKSPFTFMD